MNPRPSPATTIDGARWALLVLLLLPGCHDPAAPPQVTDALPLRAVEVVDPVVWIDQYGTAFADFLFGMAVEGSEVYVAGITDNGFLRRYTADGAEVWTRQMDALLNDVAVRDGAVYVTGETRIGLEGPGFGDDDAFVRRYDADGNVVWTRQFGTAAEDVGMGIHADETGVYVVGTTLGDLGGPSAGSHDLFIRKYDADGEHIWTRQFGSPGNESQPAIAAGGGGVYIAAGTEGAVVGDNAGLSDALVRKYDMEGNHVWTRQFGTAGSDRAAAIAYDGGVYVGGSTSGSLGGPNAGEADAYLRRYDEDGAETWTVQFGTPSMDLISDLALDGSRIYVAGSTEGDLQGTNAGPLDVFVRAYDTDRAEIWTRQLGTSANDVAQAMAVSSAGIFVSGYTEGELEGTSAGGYDVFVLRLAKSAGDQVTGLEDALDDLATAGALAAGERRSLQAKLDAVRRHLENGTAEAAISLLRAFINEVEALIRSGRLSEAEGQALVDAANALIASLGG